MAMFAYVIAAIIGAALCVMVGANVWRWIPVVEAVYSAAMVAGGIAGAIVMIIFLAYERTVIKPLESLVKKLDQQLSEKGGAK